MMDGFQAVRRYPIELEERWRAGPELLTIRPIQKTDADALDALFHRLSPDEVRLRFFAFVRELTPEQLAQFTDLDYEHAMALVAVREGTGEIVGVARLTREITPEVAEFAVLVEHDLQAHGLAVRLMRGVLGWAAAHGIREVVGSILTENTAMIELARFLGFSLTHAPDEPQVLEARLSLAPREPIASI